MEAMSSGGGGSPWEQVGRAAGLGVGSFMGAADGMSKAVASGKLAVSQEGGQALLSALDEVQRWYYQRAHDLFQVARAPQLGGTVAGGIVAPHMEQTGNDARGYITQLRAFAEAIDKFKDSINQAMKAYDHTEESNQSAVKQSGSGMHGA